MPTTRLPCAEGSLRSRGTMKRHLNLHVWPCAGGPYHEPWRNRPPQKDVPPSGACCAIRLEGQTLVVPGPAAQGARWPGARLAESVAAGQWGWVVLVTGPGSAPGSAPVQRMLCLTMHVHSNKLCDKGPPQAQEQRAGSSHLQAAWWAAPRQRPRALGLPRPPRPGQPDPGTGYRPGCARSIH